MIVSFKDLPVDECKQPSDFDKVMQDNLGIGFAECAAALADSLRERAEEVAEDLPSVAPNGDYDLLMEEPEKIIAFLRDEASKPEHWKIEYIEVKKANDQLMELIFVNDAVDEGDVLKGFVFVGLSGVIRHAFAQVHG